MLIENTKSCSRGDTYLHSKRLRKPAEGKLARRVTREAVEAEYASLGRNEGDETLARGLHPRDDRPGEVDGAKVVDAHHPLQVIDGDLLQDLAVAVARAVDEKVHWAELLRQVSDDGVDLAGV